MSILLDGSKFQPLADFGLLLEFENGEKRTFDMKPLLQMKPFDSLKDLSLFSLAAIDYGTVIWPAI